MKMTDEELKDRILYLIEANKNFGLTLSHEKELQELQIQILLRILIN